MRYTFVLEMVWEDGFELVEKNSGLLKGKYIFLGRGDNLVEASNVLFSKHYFPKSLWSKMVDGSLGVGEYFSVSKSDGSNGVVTLKDDISYSIELPECLKLIEELDGVKKYSVDFNDLDGFLSFLRFNMIIDPFMFYLKNDKDVRFNVKGKLSGNYKFYLDAQQSLSEKEKSLLCNWHLSKMKEYNKISGYKKGDKNSLRKANAEIYGFKLDFPLAAIVNDNGLVLSSKPVDGVENSVLEALVKKVNKASKFSDENKIEDVIKEISRRDYFPDIIKEQVENTGFCVFDSYDDISRFLVLDRENKSLPYAVYSNPNVMISHTVNDFRKYKLVEKSDSTAALAWLAVNGYEIKDSEGVFYRGPRGEDIKNSQTVFSNGKGFAFLNSVGSIYDKFSNELEISDNNSWEVYVLVEEEKI